MEFTVIDIISLIFSGAAFFFSLWQFRIETERNRKEATIHAFDALNENSDVLFLFKADKNKINELLEWRSNPHLQIENDTTKYDEWKKINSALPCIEHFAVGINTKIYDIGTLNRMAGNLLISTWNNCSSLVHYKRTGHANENNYSEFQTMVDSLKNIRRKGCQSIPRKFSN